MSDTPRTEAEWQSITVSAPWDAAADQMAQHARQLERELSERAESWRTSSVCRSKEARIARLELELAEARENEIQQVLSSAKAINDLREELAAERALADRLAGELKWWGDYCGDNAPASIDLTLTAWKEARCVS